MTAGDIAARSPESARVLEAHGIHFCCSGGIPLTEACLARGLDPADIITELERAAPAAESLPDEWQNAASSDLIDHIIQRHHAYLKRHLPRIHALLEEVMRSDGRRHEDVLHPLLVCFRGIKEELEARLMQQETVLFPALRELDREPPSEQHGGPELTSLRRMMLGHDATAKGLSEIRRLTLNYTPPAGASGSWQELYHALGELETDLHRHFHLENNILFRRISGLPGG